MPQIVSIEVSLSEKLTYDYNSWGISLSVGAQLLEGETLEQAADNLTSQLSQQIKRQYDNYRTALSQPTYQVANPTSSPYPTNPIG